MKSIKLLKILLLLLFVIKHVTYAGTASEQIQHFILSNSSLYSPSEISALVNAQSLFPFNEFVLNSNKTIRENFYTDGQLVKIAIDDLNLTTHPYYYLLSNGNKIYNIIPTRDCKLPRANVSIAGTLFQNSIIVDLKDLIIITPEINKTITTTDMRVLVYLIRYQDSNPIPFSATDYYNKHFGPSSGTISFFQEMSNNRFQITGKVLEWYTMHSSADSSLTTQQWSEMENYYNENYNNYDCIAYVHSKKKIELSTYTGYSSEGKINGQGRIAFDIPSEAKNYYTSTDPSFWDCLHELFCHEIGHSIGFGHAASEFCCSWDFGYGDVFDVMGGGYARYGIPPRNINSIFRFSAGWMDSTEILNIDKSGVYSIRPLEATKGYRAARIKPQTSNNYVFYLEYRKPTILDKTLITWPNSMRGIFIHATNDLWGEKDRGNTYLLDASLEPVETLYCGGEPALYYDDLVLSDTIIYYNPYHYVAIGPLVSINDDSAVFSVRIDPKHFPEPPKVISPIRWDSKPPLSIFKWAPVDNAISYHIQISTHACYPTERILINTEGIDQSFFNVTQPGILEPWNSYYFRVRARYENGYGDWSAIIPFMVYEGAIDTKVNNKASFENTTSSISCFPNPFNSKITINFNLAETQKVRLSIFNILGEEIEIPGFCAKIKNLL